VALLLSVLVSDPGFRILDSDAVHSTDSPASYLDILPNDARKKAEELLGHLHEAWTGYKSGNAASAMPGEPQANYDPAITNVNDRVAAKARELAMHDRTLWKLRAEYERDGLWALVDGRRMRARHPLGRVRPEVRAAIEEEIAAQHDESNITTVRFRRLVQARLDQTHGAGMLRAPDRSTFHRLLHKLAKGRGTFGAAKTRRSIANGPETPYSRFPATRPGEYVLIDCTELDVYAVDPISFDWIPLILTVALDLYTRSILAWRFTPRDAKDIDAALLLADIIRPKAAREGWPNEARWRYHGVPEHLVIRMGDDRPLAGIPFVYPETIVADHGKIFLSQQFIDVCARLGISIQPTRVLTPTDKAHIE